MVQGYGDAAGMREVLDWCCDLLEMQPREELYGFLDGLLLPPLDSVTSRRLGWSKAFLSIQNRSALLEDGG